jgi:16S rRNA (uracil1498-N3)-methyltransferase
MKDEEIEFKTHHSKLKAPAHRFFVGPDIFTPEKTFVLQGEIAHQLSRVLRLAPGASVILLDGTGREFLAELTHFNKNGGVEGKVIEERPAPNEPRTRLTLFQALLKGEKFDYVLQKGTEIGISVFVPVLTERVIGGSSNLKLERWRKIVREAAEQTRRGLLPQVTEPVPFSEAIKLMGEAELALLAWEDEKTVGLRSVLQSLPLTTSVSLLIGPEGGLTTAEAEQARAAGIPSVSLGPRILRAETAGPVAAALVLYELGDL